MNTATLPALTSSRFELDTHPDAFGELRVSNDVIGDAPGIRARIQADGYLFLRGYLGRDRVLAARTEVTRRFAAAGVTDPTFPALDAICIPNVGPGAVHGDFANQIAPLQAVLYAGPMMELFRDLFGGPVRHFDFTWFRAQMGGAPGIYPHCDIVYMGRGTPKLHTAWTPLGDIPMEMGGLMILENSHRQTDRLRKYLSRDVDTYCTNYPDAAEIEAGKKQWQDWDGRLTNNPVTLREKLGGRWLTTEYQMGDVLVFTMATIHASLDNQTNRYRLSSDSRYQLASEPVDDRWIGEKPKAHGVAGKRGKIC